MSKETAYSRVYMGFACLAYGADAIQEAKSDLSYAVKMDPSLTANNADRLLEIIAAYAWNHLTGDSMTFTNRVFLNLPDELAFLQRLRRQAVARTWIVGAFRAYQNKDMAKVRENGMKAVVSAPSSLLNRGFASILLQSLKAFA